MFNIGINSFLDHVRGTPGANQGYVRGVHQGRAGSGYRPILSISYPKYPMPKTGANLNYGDCRKNSTVQTQVTNDCIVVYLKPY